MTISKFVNMPSRELKKGLRSVVRKSNEDQRAVMEQHRQMTSGKRVQK